MQLLVRVLSFKGESCQEVNEVSIGVLGGCIGRREGSALVLTNDPSVSRQHGKITYDNGLFMYQDTSSNGTRLVHQDRVLSNQSIALTGGEILGVGEYQLECILEDTQSDPIYHTSVALSSGSTPPFPLTSHSQAEDYGVPPILSSASLLDESPAGSDPFMDLLLGIDNLSFEGGTDNRSLGNHGFDANESMPAISAELVKADNTPWATSVESYHAFLRGVGLHVDPSSVPNLEELNLRMEQAGRLLRAFVEGITLALQTRAELKRQIRVSVTTLEAGNNNPFKFSSNTTQILGLMLDLHTQGFKDSVLAVREGFDDLVSHQLAMNAGMQGSLLSVLKRFDPQAIEVSLDQGLVFQKKAKCWDEYCKRYPSLVATALEDIFGDDFADIYERQMDKLKKKATE